MSIGSVSGNVTARDVKVRALEAGSVSGNLRLHGIDAQRTEAKSVSGDIEFGARLAEGGRYDFNSHSGDVRLVLEDETGFELTADTFSGRVRSDFPLTLLTTRAGNARGRADAVRAVRGTFGDAGAIITARSFSGSVVVTKR
jgi:DUF4097 and DUF4098 domain-containing protein YvlB